MRRSEQSTGDLSEVQDNDYHRGYGTMDLRCCATADEVVSVDLGLLVTSRQDIFDACTRITQQIRMLARHRPAILTNVKRIFAACSCSNGHALFSFPAELREQVVQLSQRLRQQLLELIQKYRTSVTKGSTGSALRLAVNTVPVWLAVVQPALVARAGSA